MQIKSASRATRSESDATRVPADSEKEVGSVSGLGRRVRESGAHAIPNRMCNNTNRPAFGSSFYQTVILLNPITAKIIESRKNLNLSINIGYLWRCSDLSAGTIVNGQHVFETLYISIVVIWTQH